MCVCQQPEALRAYELTGSVRSADTNTHTHYGPKPRTRNRKVAWINALRVQQESGDGVMCVYYVCIVHIICITLKHIKYRRCCGWQRPRHATAPTLRLHTH